MLLSGQSLNLLQQGVVLLPQPGLIFLLLLGKQVELVLPEVLGDVGLSLEVAPTEVPAVLLVLVILLDQFLAMAGTPRK